VCNQTVDTCSSNCTDGYLKIYLKGQETMDAYDKYDYELCGTEKPPIVVSEGPRLVMVFSSGELQGRGFKVNILTLYVHDEAITNAILFHTQNRASTRSKRNTRFPELLRQTERAASRTAAHPKRKANLIHHVILPIIHPTRIVHLFLWRRPTNRLRLFSITLRLRPTMPTRRAVPMGE